MDLSSNPIYDNKKINRSIVYVRVFTWSFSFCFCQKHSTIFIHWSWFSTLLNIKTNSDMKKKKETISRENFTSNFHPMKCMYSNSICQYGSNYQTNIWLDHNWPFPRWLVLLWPSPPVCDGGVTWPPCYWLWTPRSQQTAPYGGDRSRW